MADQADVGAPANAPIVNVPLAQYNAAVDGRREFRKLYRDLREKMKWRPIESAPRDGTQILWTSEDALGRRSYAVVTYPEYIECFDEGHWLPLQFLDDKVNIGASQPAVGQLEAQVQILRKALEEIDKRCTVSSCICCRDVTDIAREAIADAVGEIRKLRRVRDAASAILVAIGEGSSAGRAIDLIDKRYVTRLDKALREALSHSDTDSNEVGK